MLCEMQSVRSRIWTRVAMSISCDDNHYTTGCSVEIRSVAWRPVGSERGSGISVLMVQDDDDEVLLSNSHNLTSIIYLHTVCSFWLIDNLSVATSPGQSEPGVTRWTILNIVISKIVMRLWSSDMKKSFVLTFSSLVIRRKHKGKRKIL